MAITHTTNRRGGREARPYEAFVFIALLAVCNWPGAARALMFLPAAVARGEWWRIVTHPFVHVSWYHLMLDGSAFAMLYHQLREPRWGVRLGFVAAGVAGSLASSWAFSPGFQTLGLCGLSGVAHGLMAVAALESIGAGDRLGWGFLTVIAVKSVWEAVTGHVVFAFLHFGLMGTPMAASHLGGLLGATGLWFAIRMLKSSTIHHQGISWRTSTIA